MELALKRLMKLIPPPAHPRFSNVNWERLEKGVGITYPSHFKAFVDVYGGCIWFDNISLVFDEAKTDTAVKKLVKFQKSLVKWLDGVMYDSNYGELKLPLYPASGGLFPFVVDYGSGIGCWKTDGINPDDWPVVYWIRGPLVILKRTSIAKMILDFLNSKPSMIDVWGDAKLYEPERLCLMETTEPEVKGGAKRKPQKG